MYPKRPPRRRQVAKPNAGGPVIEQKMAQALMDKVVGVVEKLGAKLPDGQVTTINRFLFDGMANGCINLRTIDVLANLSPQAIQRTISTAIKDKYTPTEFVKLLYSGTRPKRPRRSNL